MRMQWVRCIYMFQTSSIHIVFTMLWMLDKVLSRNVQDWKRPTLSIYAAGWTIASWHHANPIKTEPNCFYSKSKDQFCLPEALQVSVDGLRSANDFRLAVICLAIILHASWCKNIAGTRRISGISISKCLEVLSQDCTIGVWVLGCELWGVDKAAWDDAKRCIKGIHSSFFFDRCEHKGVFLQSSFWV